VDRILLEMQRTESEPPLFGKLARYLWHLRQSTHDLTGPGGLLPVHLGRKSLARERP
jgi:hypothetical protein